MTKQQLIEDNINLVYFVVTKEFPHFIHDEDIIQVGMLGLCKAADQWIEEKSKFSTFACRCIKNAILNELRSRDKHRNILSLDYEYSDDDGGGAVTLKDILVGDEDVLYIDDFSKQLKPLQRSIFGLLKKGLTPREVAEALNIAAETVYVLQRKLRILRSQDYVKKRPFTNSD